MRDIIQRHNRLNGLIFSTAEFACIALLAGGFGMYYVFHRRWIMAFIGCGIAANCVTVVVCGWRQLDRVRASGQTVGSWYSDRKAREQHRRENPHMIRDTLVFTIATLPPFVTLPAVWLDIPKQRDV